MLNDLSEALSILRNSPHFRLLSETELETIAASTSIVSFAPDETIFLKDSEADAVYFVAEGEIAIEIIQSSGRCLHVTTQHEGDVIGEFAVLDEGLRTADARSLTNSRLLVLQAEIVKRLTAQNATFAYAIIRDLIQKLRAADQHIENISFRSLKSRLAQLLLDIAAPDDDGKTSVFLTQNDLADRLSATREKINGHLKIFKEAGILETKRRKIRIEDVSALREIAAGK